MKNKEKLIYWLLNVFGSILLCLIVILAPIIAEVVWKSDDLIINTHSAEMSLIVLIPFLSSILCFIVADWKFKKNTLEDARKKIDFLFDNQFITVEQMVEMVDVLNKNEDRRQEAIIKSNLKKKEAEAKRIVEIKAREQRIHDEIQKLQEQQEQETEKDTD